MPPRSFFAGLLGALLLATPGDAAVRTKVSNASGAGVSLFDSETVQLTDQSLSTLNSTQAALFGFGKNGSRPSTLRKGECKLFPGDKSWPSESVWGQFDELLDGALIKTVPLAAACYPSWPEFDSDKCDNVTADWTVSYMQCVLPCHW